MRIGVLIQMSEEIEENLERFAGIGFTSCQLACENMDLYTDDMANRILKKVEKLGIEITALYCGWSGHFDYSYPAMYTTLGLVPVYLRAQRAQDILNGAAFARKLKVDTILSHVGYIPDNPLDYDYIEISKILRGIALEIGKYGQTFLFETGEMLPVTLIQMIKNMDCPNVGVNFDPGNFLTNGRANPLDALKMLSPYVKAMHAKDSTYPQGTDPKGKELPIGQGQADFVSLIKQLKDIGYEGDITIEREITGEEQLRDIKMAKEYLTRIIEE